jgi:hypothetical protein
LWGLPFGESQAAASEAPAYGPCWRREIHPVKAHDHNPRSRRARTHPSSWRGRGSG